MTESSALTIGIDDVRCNGGGDKRYGHLDSEDAYPMSGLPRCGCLLSVDI